MAAVPSGSKLVKVKVTCKLFPEPTKVTISKVKTVTSTGEPGDLDDNLNFWLTGSELVGRSCQRCGSSSKWIQIGQSEGDLQAVS